MEIATATAPSPLDSVSYADLYARWERGNWRAMELDFTKDAEQWKSEFTDFEREAAIWNYSLFFWGEDAVADGLSPYIDAAPLEEQKYFLATQQVDEARHAVFFNRFMKEVVGIGGPRISPGLPPPQQVDEARHAFFFNRFMKEVVGIGGPSIPDGLTAIEHHLNWGFRSVFDRLDTMCAELRRKPTIPTLAAAITLYHLVIEATLAQ